MYHFLICTSELDEEDEKGLDVPFFDLQSILEATDNFSDANKLGQGGYGPVYKVSQRFFFFSFFFSSFPSILTTLLFIIDHVN